MNIIQVQDRLKGVTDDALIGYVENPTGQVPTYLALGEIGRREKMRKEYQAQPQSTQTVAEEMIAQVTTPTGIGALTDNMAPRMAPEEVMSSSETISETGIAPLPTPNMPQNFERGGIVGYAPGGGVTAGIDYSQTNIDDTIYNPNTGTMFSDDVQVDTIGVNNNPYLPFAAEVADTYGMPRQPDVADYKDYINDKKEAFGIDNKYYDDERTAIQEEKDLIAKRREGLMPDAMIRAGLGIASGRDQDAFTNVAKGLTPAFEQYVKDDDMILKEEKLNRRENRAIDKAMRAEALGDMQGFEAYNKEIRATQLKLIEINQNKLAKALTAGISSNSAEYKLRNNAMDKAIKAMGGMYGSTAALVTKFGTDKEGYNKELMENFRLEYNALSGGIDLKDGEIERLLTLVPKAKGVVEVSKEIKDTPKVTPKKDISAFEGS